MDGMACAVYRSWAEISPQRIAGNFRVIQQVVGPEVTVVPVVKADAYRHGAAEVSHTLEQAGARWLAVSNVEEGACLRQAGIAARVLVMADFSLPTRHALFDFGLTPVIHCTEELHLLDRLAQSREVAIAYHLKVDTGMGRLGSRERIECLIAAVQSCRAARLEGLMTHFASAADYDRDQTERQVAAFAAVREQLAAAELRPRHMHLSSSAPIAYGRQDAWQTMVRPGLAIYGYVPRPNGAAPASVLAVRPALTWKAAVLAVKEIEAGAEIGYGALFRAPQAMRIAVIAAGYADGLPHRLSGRGQVIAQGRVVPILGAVSMDLTTIDATDCPALAPGDAVTLLGEDGDASLDAQDMADTAGTIPYAILCGIAARVRRIYL